MAMKGNVEVVARKLRAEGMEIEVNRLDIASRERARIRKYGLLLSPGLALNGVVQTMG